MIDAEKVFEISEINRIVKNILLSHLEKVWIGGEVSNFVEASSGHWYFSLKDSSAQIRCTMFKGYNHLSSITPKNGDQIEAFGAISLYEARGDYQINIEQVREKGTGNLFEKFVQLKDKLEKLGLFNEENKLPIPAYPKNIGIITSASGAALRDVLSVLNKQQNYNQIVIYPSAVQGKEAADEISSAISIANAQKMVDVLILCRGGGSIEDLWSIGNSDSSEKELIQRFMDGVNKFIPTLVSWNGSGFDLPVINYRALAHQINGGVYMDQGDNNHDFKYNNFISRYHSRHTDVMDFLALYGGRANASLNDIAKLCGFPGKLDMDGGDVYQNFQDGKIEAIRNYCETDVLNTYLVYLRLIYLKNQITDEEYDAEILKVKSKLSSSSLLHWNEFLTAWEKYEQ
jgi:predicted PolB exonuclease-like 3'-5' exonuclease